MQVPKRIKRIWAIDDEWVETPGRPIDYDGS